MKDNNFSYNLVQYAILRALRTPKLVVLPSDLPQELRQFLPKDDNEAQREIDSELSVMVKEMNPRVRINKQGKFERTEAGTEFVQFMEQRITDLKLKNSKFEEEQKEIKLKLKTERAVYELLRSDGISVSHAGWFLATDEKLNSSELFYAYTRIKKENEEYENIEPFVLIFEYDKNGNILSQHCEPLFELDIIEMGKVIAKVNKKSIGESSLPTQISLETVVKLLNENPTVDLQSLYSKIKEKVLRYIAFDNDIYADVVTLWIIGTYFSDIFKVYPNLFILGSPGSGKTRLTKIIVFTSRRGFMIADPTDANLPRVIEGYRPTLGLDDLDEVMRRHFPVVFSLLKHTYKESVQIPRLEKVLRGNKFLLTLFSPYAPLVMNSTEPILETQLITRYIRIDMSKTKKKFPRSDPDIYYTEKEREELYIARFLFAPKVYQIFSSIETGLVGRDDEIWSPILTIAKLINEDLYKEVKKHAQDESKQRKEELYPEEKLIIYAIEKKMGDNDSIEFTAAQLLEVIHKIVVEENKEMTEKTFERTWSTRKLGKILERMHVPTERRGEKGERLRIVTKQLLDKFKEMYDVSDVSDNGIGNGQENKPSKNEDLSQNKPVFEEKEIGRHAISTSEMSEKSENLEIPIVTEDTPEHVKLALKILSEAGGSLSETDFLNNMVKHFGISAAEALPYWKNDFERYGVFFDEKGRKYFIRKSDK
jgi:hypothetical protein